MAKKKHQISSEILFENPYWTYRFDHYSLPDGSTAEYHYVESRGSVMIIPRLEDGRIVLTEQYRYLNEHDSLEIAGGGIPDNIQPLEQAKIELKEETGYDAEKFDLIGKYNPYKGVTDEICYVFLAEKLRKGKAKPDKTEQIATKILTEDEIFDKIKKGEIWDGMTLASWLIYQSQK